jgi:alanine racemase
MTMIGDRMMSDSGASLFGREAVPLAGLAEGRAQAVMTIDLAALTDNYRFFLNKGGAADCAAVVKADAYGLGMDQVAPALAGAGCRDFYVATLDEAVWLRRILPKARIQVLGGILPGTEREVFAHRLVPVLNTPGEIMAWASFASRMDGPLPALIQIDTGMNRLGLSLAELETLAKSGLPRGLTLRLLLSHLACADEPENEMNRRQLAEFNKALSLLPGVKGSLANSAGILLGKEYCFAQTRPGIGLYGGNPLAEGPSPVKPVVSLSARILQVREGKKGDTVGYGGEGKLKKKTRFATLALGYADGVPRSFAKKGRIRIDGVDCPIIGRISMDAIAADVTKLPEIATPPGRLVDVLSAAYGVDEMAAAAGTISYEILTGLSRRCHRRYTLPRSGGPMMGGDDPFPDRWR